jgi:hypothetical protein
VKQKGRTPPPATIDHAAALRDRLGRAAYEAAFDHEPVPWSETDEARRERYRTIGEAVMREIVKRDPRQGEISTQGIVSSQNGRPYVQLAIDISPTQFTPGKAREVALMLLEAADAAESDAVLMAFARESIGLDDVRAAQLLDQFRKSREKARGTEVESA